MRALLVFAVLALAPGRARAQIANVPDLSGTFPDNHLRFDIGAGLPDIGSFALDQRTSLAAGAHVELGLRYDRVALAFDAGGRDAPAARSADGPWIWWETLAGRYSAWAGRTAVTSKHSHRVTGYTRTDVWIEAGAGREQIESNGVTLARPTALVGLAVGTTNHTERGHGSALVSLRVIRTTDPDGAVEHEVLAGITLTIGN